MWILIILSMIYLESSFNLAKLEFIYIDKMIDLNDIGNCRSFSCKINY